ncbi:MAG: 7,8-didemethyl-8-hydroxy-5-deazariboflavin synthase CofG [Candidatus Xenobia bacterium]
MNRREALEFLQHGDLAEAARLRDRHFGSTVTYSPKVFLPVTNLCRDHCSYCTFRKNPGDPGAWTMTRDEIRDTCRRGAQLGCKEALMCLGDKPELAFRSYRETLRSLGHQTTADYVYEACEIALEEGLLPHTNAGIMTRDEMARLKEVNASMGLMLENVSPRLRDKGMPHHAAPDKDPAVRMQMLREAGELQIAFTTGLLVGIGETLEERVDTVLAIRDLHAEYGHIQEVIVQNFKAKPGTRMEHCAEVDPAAFLRLVALTRILMPEMSVQAPPNLNPGEIEGLLDAGINDWGGISPLTKDYINPEAPWPHIEALSGRCAARGFKLAPRLAIYDGYRRFLHPRMEEKVPCLT